MELRQILGEHERAGLYRRHRIRDGNGPEILDGRGVIAKAPAQPGHRVPFDGFRDDQVCFGTLVAGDHCRSVIQNGVFEQIPAGFGKAGTAQGQRRGKKQYTEQKRLHVSSPLSVNV